MGGTVRKKYKILVGKPQRKRKLGRSSHNTLKMGSVGFTKVLVFTYKATQCNPEGYNSRYLISKLVINIAFYYSSDAGFRTYENPHA
jgi:hypothetical protein